jgi:hypothetical protein
LQIWFEGKVEEFITHLSSLIVSTSLFWDHLKSDVVIFVQVELRCTIGDAAGKIKSKPVQDDLSTACNILVARRAKLWYEFTVLKITPACRVTGPIGGRDVRADSQG